MQPKTPPISALFRNGKKRDGVLQKISKSSPQFYKKFQKPDHSFEKKFKIQTSVLQKISKPSTASPAQPTPIHTHHPTTPNNTRHAHAHTHTQHTHAHEHRTAKAEAGGRKKGGRAPENRKQAAGKSKSKPPPSPGEFEKTFTNSQAKEKFFGRKRDLKSHNQHKISENQQPPGSGRDFQKTTA